MPSRLELFFMMNVAKYLSSVDDLYEFCRVSKKCQETLNAFQQNFFFVDSTIERELKFFNGIQNYKGYNTITTFPHKQFEFYDIKGVVEGIPLEKIRSLNTGIIPDDCEKMTNLRHLEFYIEEDDDGWQLVDADDFKPLSLLENLKTVKFVIENPPFTPLEEYEKPDIYEDFIDAITNIGPKPLIVVVNCDPQYTNRILAIGDNVRVRQIVRNIDKFSQEIKNEKIYKVTNCISGDVNDLIDGDVIQKYGFPIVKLHNWEYKHKSNEKTFDLSKYNALYDLSLSCRDFEYNWVLPTNLTRLYMFDQNIVNLSQLQNLQILITNQIPQCQLNQLTYFELSYPKKFNAKEINDIGNVKEFIIECFREELLDLYDLKLTNVNIRHFNGKNIVLSPHIESLIVSNINIEQLVIPKSVKTLYCHASENLISLQFENGIQLESVILYSCENLNKFTLPKSVKTLKLESDIEAKILNIQELIL
ncbi:hypothetical protein EIN_264880 [Entamoeba invadens IP1]|uniref:Uncharacterized protein n=1 Tax=Entamoeba invadens IP1 TaxID=370355 RepID=A0A0A1TWV9_ENTIV|nr:hypothetical protein EIN_264880 [Entamoeba invadens IP1]ELP85701.1 hypothetical protein EIN_264880 [Entamoeba invadens IP1]|eukprot:XP_004185047.1 hypothetical protein EIN_264880 [Entamoeba invadens IP1]